MNYSFSAEIIHDKEINQYIGFVPGLPGAHTQAKSLDELYVNLQEVILLCLVHCSFPDSYRDIVHCSLRSPFNSMEISPHASPSSKHSSK